MSFAAPWAFAALAALPLVLGFAWWTRRRHRRAAVRVSSAALVRAALPGRGQRRRRIPAVLLVVALAVLGVAAARPRIPATITSSSTTILLAVDVSESMCSTDVAPNRLSAAEKAATRFIGSQPHGERIGLVAFAGIAGVLVRPTSDTSKLQSALKTLTTGRGTAIGQAILTSIDAIAAVDGAVAPTGARVSGPAGPPFAADAIVVLTDGANTEGPTPETAARQASARHVRVYTIGFGTSRPAPTVCDSSQYGDGTGFGGPGGFQGGPGGFGGGGFGGPGGFGGGFGRNPLTPDPQALQHVARITDAKYYRAQNLAQLTRALNDLPRHVTVTHEQLDIADLFAAVGGLLAALAIGLSLWWNRVRRRQE